MPPNVPSLVVRPAAHAIATALSFTVGGPLAAFTGAFVGGFLGESGVEFTRIATEKLAEAAGEGLLGDSLERLAEGLRPYRSSIQSIHRNALRETLAEIGREADPVFSGWFKNWDECLGSKEALDLEELSLDRLLAANPDDLDRRTLERLNAQGASIRAMSLVLGGDAEPALLMLVQAGRDKYFPEKFKHLLAEPENDSAWKQAQHELQLANNRLLGSISTGVASANEKLDEVLRLLTRLEFTPEVIAGSLDPAPGRESVEQKTRIKELANQLNSTREAVTGFLSILREDEVPLEQLPAKLALIAQRHIDLLDRLTALNPEDAEARRLIEGARELLVRAKSSADYDAADGLLSQAEEAQNRTLQRAEELEHEAKEAARRLRAGAAATRAERGELSLTRLNYLQAAAHFRAASEVISADDAEMKCEYLFRSAGALKSHGDEMGDNTVLKRAIEVYREVLSQTPRKTVPLDWATTQNNLGAALETLGERESGTGRLEEAVAAYRAALEERTRERVPLNWAGTQNNLGNALETLGARESGTGRLEEAVAAYRAALEERTRERVPLDWARTQNNLGNALQTLGERESGTERLEEAVAVYRAALEERTRERVPLDWAMTQNNLGNALGTLGSGRAARLVLRSR